MLWCFGGKPGTEQTSHGSIDRSFCLLKEFFYCSAVFWWQSGHATDPAQRDRPEFLSSEEFFYCPAVLWQQSVREPDRSVADERGVFLRSTIRATDGTEKRKPMSGVSSSGTRSVHTWESGSLHNCRMTRAGYYTWASSSVSSLGARMSTTYLGVFPMSEATCENEL